MNSRYLIPGGVAVVVLASAWGGSRLYIRAQEEAATPPPLPRMSPLPPGMMSEGMMPPRVGLPKIKPSRRLEFPAFSPDGRFIGVLLAKVREQDSEFLPVVVDARSGQVVTRGDVSREAGLSWLGQSQQTYSLVLGWAVHNLAPAESGKGWKLTHLASVGRLAPEGIRTRNEFVGQPPVALLPHASLAIWFLHNGTTGRGQMVASDLSNSQEIPLPEPLKTRPHSNSIEFAAPSLRKGGPRVLAATFEVAQFSEDKRLEVWDLSRSRRLFERTLKGAFSPSLEWTRDGSFLVVGGVGRPIPVTDPEGTRVENGRVVKNKDAPTQYTSDGVDIYDGRTGAVRAALKIEGNADLSRLLVSNDGRYFLTRDRIEKAGKRVSRISIRAIPSGKLVCTFEREREITASPRFAAHDSSLLVWASEDTIFLQSWKPSKVPQKLAPRRIKIPLKSPMFN